MFLLLSFPTMVIYSTLSLSLWKSHLLTRKDSQLFYDGPHPMQAPLTLLPALCKDIQINQVQNQPFKKPFVTDGSKKLYPCSPPQDCGYNIFCFVFKHLALISRANIGFGMFVMYILLHCFTLSLLILLVFLISMWILVTQLLHIFASFTSPFLCTIFYAFR